MNNKKISATFQIIELLGSTYEYKFKSKLGNFYKEQYEAHKNDLSTNGK